MGRVWSFQISENSDAPSVASSVLFGLVRPCSWIADGSGHLLVSFEYPFEISDSIGADRHEIHMRAVSGEPTQKCPSKALIKLHRMLIIRLKDRLVRRLPVASALV